MPGASTRPTVELHPALDGLRALAVMTVVASQLGVLGGGVLGFEVFFVLSGFVVTRLLFSEWESTGTISLRQFWARRFRRLVPAFLVVLLVTMTASKWLLAPERMTTIRDDALVSWKAVPSRNP